MNLAVALNKDEWDAVAGSCPCERFMDEERLWVKHAEPGRRERLSV